MSNQGGERVVFARMMAEREIPYLELPRPVNLAAARMAAARFFTSENDATFAPSDNPERKTCPPLTLVLPT